MADWSAGTFEESRLRAARGAALASAAERFAWLAASRRYAASTGALQAELERRAQVQLQNWHRHDDTDRH